MNRLDELSLKLLDGSIGEDEVKELAELARTAEGGESFLRLIELESHLLSFGRSSIAGDVVTELENLRCRRVEEAVMREVCELSERTHPKEAASRLPHHRYAAVVIGIATLAACLVFAIVQFGKDDGGNVSAARLHVHGADVRIIGAEWV